MASYVLNIPDNCSDNYFGPFQSVKKAKEFLLKNYPTKIEKLGMVKCRSTTSNLLIIHFNTDVKNKDYDFNDDYSPEFYNRNIASLHEMTKENCSLSIRDEY
jgi:hypothetical protein